MLSFAKVETSTKWAVAQYGEAKSPIVGTRIMSSAYAPIAHCYCPNSLTLQLGSSYGKKYFLSCAKKTSNLASINSTQVKAFPFQLPTLTEQQRFVREIEQLQSVSDALELHLKSTSNTLKTLTEAFA